MYGDGVPANHSWIAVETVPGDISRRSSSASSAVRPTKRACRARSAVKSIPARCGVVDGVTEGPSLLVRFR